MDEKQQYNRAVIQALMNANNGAMPAGSQISAAMNPLMMGFAGQQQQPYQPPNINTGMLGSPPMAMPR